ncbi:CLOCK-interacting pacemaker [Ascaphus truei]|uniref:CLOCK-interacting pacemaker n=1 Tax=Ascaphus truei TaxID=8439 RepID=UPI003F5A3476
MEKNQAWSTGQERPRPGHGTAQKARPRNMEAAAPESDKDSGYSDVASECLSSVEQTDSEEGPSASRWYAAKTASGSPDSLSRAQSRPSPVVTVKHLLVDQGSGPDTLIRSWTVHPSFQLLQASHQALLSPPTSSPAQTLAPCTKRAKYLPILNSYTKIAPHPFQHSPMVPFPRGGKKGGDVGYHSRTKRSCPGTPCESHKETDTRGCEGEGRAQRDLAAGSDPHSDTRQNSDVPAGSLGTTEREPTAASSQEIQQSMQETELVLLAERKSKKRCFMNTLDALHCSGLLGIAIQTKELARLNQATQSQLERLREQTQLYAKAVGSNHPQDWQRLADSF